MRLIDIDGDQQCWSEVECVHNRFNHQVCALKSDLGYIKIASRTFGYRCPYGDAMECGRCKARRAW